MKRVNLCAASIPHTPCALTRALAHALRQSASEMIDARLTQLTQAGDVMANLNEGPSDGGAKADAGLARGIRQFFGSMGFRSTLRKALICLAFRGFHLQSGAADE